MVEARQVAMREKAYELHYQLMQHYSSQIFRARIAITTVTLVVAAYALDVANEEKSIAASIVGFQKRPIVAFLGAMFIVLLCLMEVGYLKRFYEVVTATREFEESESLPGYASRYVAGEAASIFAVYGLSILLLVGIFVGATFPSHQSSGQRCLVLLLAALPLLGVLLVFRKLRAIGKSLGPRKPVKTSRSKSKGA